MNVGDLLDGVDDFEQRLEHYLLLVRDQSKDNNVRLVAYCLALQRRHQETALSGLKPDLLLNARKIKIKSGVAFNPVTDLALPAATPDRIKAKELIEAALSYSNDLLSRYRAIAAKAVENEVRAVLDAFVTVKERDIVMLKKMLAMHYF